ncbi:membrane protein of unknown function (plasmid) [Caballeronia sp. S22]
MAQPLAATVSLVGSSLDATQRWLVGRLGIRGVSAFYCLLFSLECVGKDQLKANALIVLGRIVLPRCMARAPRRCSNDIANAGKCFGRHADCLSKRASGSDERLGKWQFWLFFIGFDVTFFPMHLLGLPGMPRRVWTYPHAMGWDGMNVTATIGACVIALSVVLFIVNVVKTLGSDKRAAADPWGAGTLEWSVPSSPPPHNFDAIPVVHGRDPLWEPSAQPAFVAGLAADNREVLVTSVLDAQPDHRPMFPTSSIWPFASAVATTILFISSIYTPSASVWGSLPVAVAMIGWFWPNRGENRLALARERRP